MLRDDLFDACRTRHYSRNTAETYWGWSQRFLRWKKQQAGQWVHPSKLDERDVTAYLSHLAIDRRVAASTQNQALNSLLFLFGQVIGQPLGNIDAVRAKRPQRVPTVLSVDEVVRLLDQLSGLDLLAAELMYGAGLRVGEVFAMRIQDVDFGRRKLTIRQAKGAKDRETMLPQAAVAGLKRQIATVSLWHAEDLRRGRANVDLPGAFIRKSPRSASERGWYFVFASERLSISPETGKVGRWHQQPDRAQKSVRIAARASGIVKRVTCHTLRHSLATHFLEHGNSIEQLRILLGHNDIRTTQIYLHCVASPAEVCCSPLARLAGRKRA